MIMMVGADVAASASGRHRTTATPDSETTYNYGPEPPCGAECLGTSRINRTNIAFFETGQIQVL